MVNPAASPSLEVCAASVAYGALAALSDLSFALERGQIGCLLGPSGCGKTTALRAVAGFEPLVAGAIRLEGTVISQPGYTLAPEKRRIGMVFQDYALFPHLTVAGNIGFGLTGMRGADRARRVADMLLLTGLSGSGAKYPHELSGGQQQRVALARALAPQPQLMLLDEPFSNLDTELRERLSLELRAILKAANTTAILVTHDQHEAFAIADVIGLMNRGRIEQWDAAYNLYHRPANRFVADFIGQGVFVSGKVLSDNQVQIEFGALAGAIPMPCHQGCDACGKGCSVDVLLRPDDVIHDDASPILAEVLRKAFRGAEFLYTLRLPSGREVLALVPSHHNHAIGEKIGIRLEVDHVVAFSQQARVP